MSQPRRSARIAALKATSGSKAASCSKADDTEASKHALVPLVASPVPLPNRMDEVEMDMNTYEDLFWEAYTSVGEDRLHAMTALFKFVADHPYVLTYGNAKMIPDLREIVELYHKLYQQHTERFANAMADSIRQNKYAYVTINPKHVEKTIESHMKMHNLFVSVYPYAARMPEALAKY